MNGLEQTRFPYLARIWNLRYFWFSLVANDLSHRYKRSFLGVGWSLVRPLAMTFLFCLVFGQLFQLDPAEYAPHLLIGMTIWQFFTECLVQGCQSFSNGSAYIRQQPVPLAIFPLRTVLGATFHTLIALTLAILLTLFFRGSLHVAAMLSLIPAIVLLFALGWSLAILGGILQTHFPDTQHILDIGLQFLFYLTPIIYKAEAIESRTQFGWLVRWNPMTSLLALFRTPIMDGAAPAWQDIGVGLGLLAIASVLAIAMLKKLERNLVFWI